MSCSEIAANLGMFINICFFSFSCVGYSFTDNVAGLARNESDVARDLYAGLVQFFTLFSEFQQNDFFIIGESYAGKNIGSF